MFTRKTNRRGGSGDIIHSSKGSLRLRWDLGRWGRHDKMTGDEAGKDAVGTIGSHTRRSPVVIQRESVWRRVRHGHSDTTETLRM